MIVSRFLPNKLCEELLNNDSSLTVRSRINFHPLQCASICRWTYYNFNPSDGVLWWGRSILFPNIGQGHEENGRHHSETIGSGWETSDDLCWYVNTSFSQRNSHFSPIYWIWCWKYSCCVVTGNVAWAHIRAKETMKKSPKNISGLPVFVTDDTPIEDTSRFCQRMSRRTDAFNIRPTSWSIPSLLGYWLCILLEMMISLLNPIFGTKLSFQPRALAAYAGSLLQYSRLRAELHMDYEPIYTEERSLDESVKWYEKWYKSHFNMNSTSKKAK